MKSCVAMAASLCALNLSAADYRVHEFTKTHLDPHFWCEGANFGDFNRDGQADIVSGPYWYAGPDFKKRSLSDTGVTVGTFHPFAGVFGRSNVSQMALSESR